MIFRSHFNEMRCDSVLLLLSDRLFLENILQGHILNTENMFILFTTSHWPFQNANTHSFLCFHHFVWKVSMDISFQASLSLQPLRNPVHLIKDRVEDRVEILTSLYFHG